jgi:hypothetical protein
MSRSWRSIVVPAVALAGLAGLSAGCAGESKARRPRTLEPAEEAPAARGNPRFRPGTWAVGEAEEVESGVALQQQLGYLSQGDVEGALDRHSRSLIACYERAGEAQRYAQGRVVLRFLVQGTGKVRDVMVVSSELGNYAVERCLVVEGRAIPFPRPEGNQDTDFEYTLQFRSSGEVDVLNWDAGMLAKDLSAQAVSLQSCGQVAVGREVVQAVAYVQPGGAVASVGLSSQSPLDVMSAMCVVEQIRKWRLPAQSGHMVRTSFPLVASNAGMRPVPASNAEPGRAKRPVRRTR